MSSDLRGRLKDFSASPFETVPSVAVHCDPPFDPFCPLLSLISKMNTKEVSKVREWLRSDLGRTKQSQNDPSFSQFLNDAGAHSQDTEWIVQRASEILKEVNNSERSMLFRIMLASVYANAYLVLAKYLSLSHQSLSLSSLSLSLHICPSVFSLLFPVTFVI